MQVGELDPQELELSLFDLECSGLMTLTENSEWDDRLLAEQIKILSEGQIDFDLEVIGFETAEIDMLIEGLAPNVKNDAADVLPEVPENRSAAPAIFGN